MHSNTTLVQLTKLLFIKSIRIRTFAVCRAWMKNEPHNTNMAPRLRTPTPEPEEKMEDEIENNDEEEQSVEKDIYKLPPPEPLGVNAFGEEESIRIPMVEAKTMDKTFEVKVGRVFVKQDDNDMGCVMLNFS